MTRPVAEKATACRHDEESYERCEDGYFCPECNEGVCPDCRRLWAPTGNISAETGDFEEGPACRCHEPVILPYRA